MKSNISESDWKELQKRGYLNIKAGISNADMYELDCIVNSLVEKHPNGFDVAPLYTGQKSLPRQSKLPPTEKYIIPNVGFLEPALLKPLSNPYIYNLIEKIVGKDFYLSNTWFQKMPPGAGRLGYHKDPRGSITLNLLLDDIDDKMGSTCLIPGSHVNTPPANYSIRHTECEHKDEIDLTGSAGDLAIFTPETWHGRSENLSNKYTRRLFYNFYSRSSKNNTAWHDVVSDAEIEAAKAAIPSNYHHMFHIDKHKTAELQRITGTKFRKNIFKARSPRSEEHTSELQSPR